MTKLLECQKLSQSTRRKDNGEELRLFAIALLCSLLDIFETDLTNSELEDIRHFAEEWCK